MKIKVGTRSSVPSGEYKVVVENIEKEEKFKRQNLVFYFRIVEGPYKDSILRGFINVQYESFSEHTKLYDWLSKTLGYAPELNEEIDTDVFYNRVLIVQVESKASKKTGNSFGNVTRIIRTDMEL